MATAKKAKTTSIVAWDEELAKQAEIAAGMEASVAAGQFFSIKAGVLSWNDAPIPGNAMPVIIVDSILENVYYEGEYDPDTPQSPTCFAFGRDDKTMSPHKDVIAAGNQQCGASGLCAGCEMNEFGTAEKGRGKACRNTRRLAMIPAGNFDKSGKVELIDDEDHFKSTPIGFMKLPVTSVKGYAAFVKQVAGALRRPPHGIITKVSVVPDPKTQFRVVFEPIDKVPNELMGIIMDRNKEAQAVIDFPYTPVDEEPAPKARRGAAKSTKTAAKRPAQGKRKY
jgi:hypothetical protein